ncbi:MAG: class II fructose-bisphosphate aldolase [Phycisphaerales bacterium]|nr:class II fructose-bisphosphate aldolase [Phycisphaerales bacterium]
MALENVKTIVRCADENGFAALAVNVFDYVTARWAIMAAEREKLPVILAFYPGWENFIPLKIIADICLNLARHAKVPIGVHLDHSNTFNAAMSGIPTGFQSIMFDGSALPFEENVAITRKVVDSAHLFGVDVEAELGFVGSGGSREDFMNTEHYTDPKMAAKFIELSGADTLAVAIGNAHGAYACEPHLDIKRLAEINRTIDTPLVLHGGSCIPSEQVKESVRHGINKVNLATEFLVKCKLETAAKFGGNGDVLNCLDKAGEEVIAFLQTKFRSINPSGYQMR